MRTYDHERNNETGVLQTIAYTFLRILYFSTYDKYNFFYLE